MSNEFEEQESSRLAMLDAFYEAQLYSPEKLAKGKKSLLEQGNTFAGREIAPIPLGIRRGISVVAQGDSWFDYLPGNDIIKALKRRGFFIKNYGTGGDTLENMLFGTEYKEGRWTRQPAEHEEVLESLRKIQPKFFLFSGGGNDIAGPELAPYLNHYALEPHEPLREDHLNFMFRQVFRKSYEYMIKSVQNAHPGVQIILHGYGYAAPTGKGVVNIGNWRFAGPWLLPTMITKGILDPVIRIGIVKRMINVLNEMLADLAQSTADVHYIDLRGIIKDSDWVNELHLNRAGYEKVGDVYLKVMSGLMSNAERAELVDAQEFVSAFMAGDDTAMQILRQAE